MVSRTTETLDAMRRNPQADWTIGDVERVCRQIGADCSAPTRGSHYKISSKNLEGALTIPFRRPIKTRYIKDFVRFAEAQLRINAKGNGND